MAGEEPTTQSQAGLWAGPALGKALSLLSLWIPLVKRDVKA